MTATPTSNISFQNFFSATLSSDITATSTDIFLDTIPNGSEGFLVIDPDSTSGREIIYYNSKTATKVVCPSVADGRGQDDTTAGAHLQGTTVIMAPVAAFYETLLSLFLTSPQGWASSGAAVSSVTHNGNRSYTLVTGTDVSSLLSPGMRVKTTRTVAAPTQSTTLNGTTQYWSKATPAGMTFTDDFACGAWVYITATPAAASVIISKFNGTSGFQMYIETDGTIRLVGYSAGAANYSRITSYAALPLNTWVHVAAQLDMSAFTATSTTSYVMFDGQAVGSAVSRGGTNPTAMVQAGNLEIGGANGGGTPLAGTLAQVWVSSAKVTQANVKSLMTEGLTASVISTNNIISAYSFDGSATDLNTSNANNLTANGSATATTAMSPFGTQGNGTISSTLDYGIIASISGTTINIQVPIGCTIPTVGGVSSLAYSTYDSPYGFPRQPDLWSISRPVPIDQNSAVSATYVALGYSFPLPIGSWSVSWRPYMFLDTTSTSRRTMFATLSTTTTTETYPELTVALSNDDEAAAAKSAAASMFASTVISTATAITLNTLNKLSATSSVNNYGLLSGTDNQPTYYRADFALL